MQKKEYIIRLFKPYEFLNIVTDCNKKIKIDFKKNPSHV